MDHPDRVQLDLDKKGYRIGEKAVLQIKAPFAGRALVTVEREKIYDVYTVELKENTGMISIPVKESYKPNVYVSVHLIRGIKLLDKRAPARAFGTIPLVVDCSENRLKVEIVAAEEYRPNRTVEVELAVEGGGDEAQVTLAAVDEGICQLTEFATPDPWEFFYGKRALSLETYDLYGMLLPEVEPVDTKESPAGDEEMDNVRRRNLNPVAIRRVKPVSLWSGLVRLDAEGKARVRLDLPQFNGTLRLMAVAVSGARFGSAAKKVLVRDPIVLTSTYPRVLAPGDRAEIAVGVFNGTGRKGEFTLELRAEGPVRISGFAKRAITLEKGEEKMVTFAIAAKEAAGPCRFVLRAAGNGVVTTETTELAVRPAAPAISAGFAGSVAAGKASTIELPGGWLPGTARYSLTLSPLPAIRFAGGLRYLLGYPYGCIEQTTSKVFPLLYFADLARAANDLLPGGKAEAYVRQGIEKLQSMQLQDGSFSFWPGTDYVSEWGSIYAAHFLVEARKAGYAVSDRVYDRMLTWLETMGRKTIEGPWSRQLRVYALYVLSLAGKPQLSSMAFIKGQQLSELMPDSRAQLAAAYYYANDRQTAREILPNTFAAYTGRRETAGNFNSAVRSDAIILSVLADLDPSHPAIPRLVDRLVKAIRIDAWGTTQENAFALMALGKLMRRKGTGDYTGEVLVNGKVIAVFDAKGTKRLDDPKLGGGEIVIRVEGTGECYYYAEAAGVPEKPPTAVSHGLKVERGFFDRRGGRLDPARIRQGDLVVVGLTVETGEDNVKNVALVDLLPAGLEIENPRLATTAELGWVSENSFTPTYVDIRDDRLIVFADFGRAGVYRFYYAARAVSRGTFALPPLRAECMYEPEVYGVASGGEVRIVD
ncbi:MAG: alpha-2-macroglobulin family protein [Bacillota bacterium]